MEHLSDEALMSQVAKGNLEVLGHLFQRYHQKIYNYCLLMIRDEEISKDITQDVFFKILKHRATFKNTRFSPWIYTIARNLCSDHYQSQKKTKKYLTDLTYLESLGDESESLGSENRLRAALDLLATDDKELIIMSKYQKMKYKEIAEITGSTVTAAKTKTHRAMMKLRTHYFKNTQSI